MMNRLSKNQKAFILHGLNRTRESIQNVILLLSNEKAPGPTSMDFQNAATAFWNEELAQVEGLIADINRCNHITLAGM